MAFLETDIGCSAGGVKLVSGTSRITLDNTLDERLRLLEDRVRNSFRLPTSPLLTLPHPALCTQMLPEIRNNLFGPNPNRKFYS